MIQAGWPLGLVVLLSVLPAGVTGEPSGSEENVAAAAVSERHGDSATACEVRSWEVLWGVKESFRAYLSGSLANGEWSVTGEVTYATPLFTIRGTDGVLAPDRSFGEMTSTGSIGFFGHEGLLDQTLSAPRLLIDDDRVDVVFDISGDTQEGRTVSAQDVSFVSVDASNAVVDSEAGTWSVDQAPTVLTTAGAEAFGTYPAGEAFDPIDIRVQVDPGCLQPPLSTPWFLGVTLGSAVTVSVAIVLVRRWRGRERPTPGVS